MRALWIFPGLYLVIVLLVAIAAFQKAARGYRIEKEWSRPTTHYSARVVGEETRTSYRIPRSSPIVEVVFADERKIRFTSSFSVAISYLATGSSVNILTKKVEDSAGTYDLFEIDDAFYLWIGDAIVGTFLILVLVGLPVFFYFQPLTRLRRFIVRPQEE